MDDTVNASPGLGELLIPFQLQEPLGESGLGSFQELHHPRGLQMVRCESEDVCRRSFPLRQQANKSRPKRGMRREEPRKNHNAEMLARELCEQAHTVGGADSTHRHHSSLFPATKLPSLLQRRLPKADTCVLLEIDRISRHSDPVQVSLRSKQHARKCANPARHL